MITMKNKKDIVIHALHDITHIISLCEAKLASNPTEKIVRMFARHTEKRVPFCFCEGTR
jgi:hypothetical protein